MQPQTNDRSDAPLRAELLAVLKYRYGVASGELEAMDNVGLIRVVAAHDFLENNLPQRLSGRGTPRSSQ